MHLRTEDYFTTTRSSHWEVFYKKIVLFFSRSQYCGHWSTCSEQKCYSHRRLFFSQVILPEIRTGSFSQEFNCSVARNKFRTDANSMIFNYLTDLTNHNKHKPVSLLRIKRNVVIFPARKQIPQRNTSISQENK